MAMEDLGFRDGEEPVDVKFEIIVWKFWTAPHTKTLRGMWPLTMWVAIIIWKECDGFAIHYFNKWIVTADLWCTDCEKHVDVNYTEPCRCRRVGETQGHSNQEDTYNEETHREVERILWEREPAILNFALPSPSSSSHIQFNLVFLNIEKYDVQMLGPHRPHRRKVVKEISSLMQIFWASGQCSSRLNRKQKRRLHWWKPIKLYLLLRLYFSQHKCEFEMNFITIGASGKTVLVWGSFRILERETFMNDNGPDFNYKHVCSCFFPFLTIAWC